MWRPPVCVRRLLCCNIKALCCSHMAGLMVQAPFCSSPLSTSPCCTSAACCWASAWALPSRSVADRHMRHSRADTSAQMALQSLVLVVNDACSFAAQAPACTWYTLDESFAVQA